MNKILILLSITLFFNNSFANSSVPNLTGEWNGINKTISESKGLKTWEKKIIINDQTDRRFTGSFTYTDGSKKFYGVIHPDNETFTWVSSNSRGYNFGKILDTNRISACYVEPGIDSTAGCADLVRE